MRVRCKRESNVAYFSGNEVEIVKQLQCVQYFVQGITRQILFLIRKRAESCKSKSEKQKLTKIAHNKEKN